MARAVTESQAPGKALDAAAPVPGVTRRKPKVILHIGEPKTGTTFLQQVIWRNRDALATQGVVLPGHHPQDHFRATQDLRGLTKLASDPAGAWDGEWQILASQARQAPRVAVISHELFCAADAVHAARAVSSLAPAEVHVVLTVRDVATLLPAEWQETVKHRNPLGFEDWLVNVIDRESGAPDRRQWWYWRVHDTLEILRIWSEQVPAERVHVITVPPRGSDVGLLWQRFASLLEVEPGSVDLSRARANASLGLPEVEFLRRLNAELPAEIPDWFYMWQVKEVLAHEALATAGAGGGAGRTGGRLELPPERASWALSQAETLIAGLQAGGYDVIGDPGELLPGGGTGEPGPTPAELPAGQVLDAAVAATAALVLNQYRKEYPAAAPQHGLTGRGALADRVVSTVAGSPRLKRTVRDLSSRHSSVRQLRVLAWRALEGARARKSP